MDDDNKLKSNGDLYDNEALLKSISESIDKKFNEKFREIRNELYEVKKDIMNSIDTNSIKIEELKDSVNDLDDIMDDYDGFVFDDEMDDDEWHEFRAEDLITDENTNLAFRVILSESLQEKTISDSVSVIAEEDVNSSKRMSKNCSYEHKSEEKSSETLAAVYKAIEFVDDECEEDTSYYVSAKQIKKPLFEALSEIDMLKKENKKLKNYCLLLQSLLDKK